MPAITISAEDLYEVMDRILPFRRVDGDGTSGLEAVQVAPTEEGLRWTTSDSFRMGSLVRGESDLTEPVLLPPSLIDFAVRHATRNDLDEVRFEVDEDRTMVTLAQPELQVPRPTLQAPFVDVDALLYAAPDRQLSELEVAGENLRAAVHATITYSDSAEDSTDHPVALQMVADDTLQVLAEWPDTPDTHAYLSATADGPVHTVVNARYLQELLDAAGSHDLRIFVGTPTEPLRVRTDDGFHGLLMPIHAGQPDLERVMAEFLEIDTDTLFVGDDGSIPVSVGDTEITAFLVETDDPFGRGNIVRFAAVVARELVESLPLLREINELNDVAHLCRLVFHDGAVIVAAENLLATLDTGEIEMICEQLLHHVETFGPLLSAVHSQPTVTASRGPDDPAPDDVAGEPPVGNER